MNEQQNDAVESALAWYKDSQICSSCLTSTKHGKVLEIAVRSLRTQLAAEKARADGLAKELSTERELAHGLGRALNAAKRSGNACDAAMHAETAAVVRAENHSLRNQLAAKTEELERLKENDRTTSILNEVFDDRMKDIKKERDALREQLADLRDYSQGVEDKYESRIAELVNDSEQLATARLDFSVLAEALQDATITDDKLGQIDPTDYLLEGDTWTSAWDKAISAARTAQSTKGAKE